MTDIERPSGLSDADLREVIAAERATVAALRSELAAGNHGCSECAAAAGLEEFGTGAGLCRDHADQLHARNVQLLEELAQKRKHWLDMTKLANTLEKELEACKAQRDALFPIVRYVAELTNTRMAFGVAHLEPGLLLVDAARTVIAKAGGEEGA